MPNTLITSSIILNEALLELKNTMVLGELVDKQYSNEFGDGQALKRGESVRVRRRINFAATDAYGTDGDMTGNVSDIIEGSAEIKMEHQQSVVFEVSSQDLTLDISQFSERYIRPAMIELAQKCETDIAAEFQKAPWLETGGINDFQSIARLDAILDDYGVPMMDRNCVITPIMMVQLSAILTTNFVQDIARRAVENALVTTLGGFPIYKFQSGVNRTVGAYGTSTPVVSGAGQQTDYATVKDNDYLSGTLATSGWDLSVTGVLTAGDTFTIDGVYQVNHRTREATSRLQQFVVLADADSDAGGLATLSISPAIITTGAYKTVDIVGDVLPDAAAITIESGAAGARYREGMAFHKQALTLATADLEAFRGGVDNSTGNLDGYAMRVAMDSDVLRDKTICRLDMLYGVRLLEPRAAVRISEI